MDDMGIEDNYLVFKTVPFGMDEATELEYRTVLTQTNSYRENVLKELL